MTLFYLVPGNTKRPLCQCGRWINDQTCSDNIPERLNIMATVHLSHSIALTWAVILAAGASSWAAPIPRTVHSFERSQQSALIYRSRLGIYAMQGVTT